MGQRHQYIISYPAEFLNEGNPNNKPPLAEVIHHQWLYGRSAIFALDRVLRLVKNMLAEGPDYHFGTDSRGYRDGSGTDAISAAISVCPDTGYFHKCHIWEDEKEKWRNFSCSSISLEPDQFDNNDGITLIEFRSGSKKPKIAIITPNHIEGSHWDVDCGRGPWTPLEYLEFYYNKSDQKKFEPEIKEALGSAFRRISDNSEMLTKDEVKTILPKFSF